MNIEIISRDTAEKIIAGGFSENTAVISFYDPKSRRTPTGYKALDYSGVCNRVFYVGILIKKIWIDGEKCSIQAEFNGYGEVISILQYGDLTDDEENLICSGFKKMCLPFPHRSKKVIL